VDGRGGLMSRLVGVGETPTPRPGDGRRDGAGETPTPRPGDGGPVRASFPVFWVHCGGAANAVAILCVIDYIYFFPALRKCPHITLTPWYIVT